MPRTTPAQIITKIRQNGQNAEDILNLNAAIIAGSTLRAVYCDSDGVISARSFIPYATERCKNGNVIVRAFDNHRASVRSFSLAQLTHIVPVS